MFRLLDAIKPIGNMIGGSVLVLIASYSVLSDNWSGWVLYKSPVDTPLKKLGCFAVGLFGIWLGREQLKNHKENVHNDKTL